MRTIGCVSRELSLTRIVILLVLPLFVSCSISKNIPYYYQLDKPPVYISQKDGRTGDGWFLRDLMQSIEISQVDDYPKYSRIKLSVIIDKRGHISKVHFMEDYVIELKRAIIAALKQTSKWSPGLLDGESVKCVKDFSIQVDYR